jgi:succinate dehydrogenase/fumarate reductase flavoprotein subunit
MLFNAEAQREQREAQRTSPRIASLRLSPRSLRLRDEQHLPNQEGAVVRLKEMLYVAVSAGMVGSTNCVGSDCGVAVDPQSVSQEGLDG